MINFFVKALGQLESDVHFAEYIMKKLNTPRGKRYTRLALMPMTLILGQQKPYQKIINVKSTEYEVETDNLHILLNLDWYIKTNEQK